MRKISKPIGATVLLALAASTAIRLRSWRSADLSSDWEYYASSEWRRKLLHKRSGPGHLRRAPGYNQPFVEKAMKGIKRSGVEPGTEHFEEVLRGRVMNQEKQLVAQLAKYHSSHSVHDKAWRALVREGKSPGTPSFERLLEKRTARRVPLREARLKKQALESKRKQNGKETQEIGEATRQLKADEGTEKKLLDVWLQSDYGVGGRKAVTEAAAKFEEELRNIHEDLVEIDKGGFQPLAVCDRNADVGSTEDFASLHKYAECPEITKAKPILLLEGYRKHGRTGNNLIEFLHAIQEARDLGIQLGIMHRSWAMKLILQMWMAIDSDDWQKQFERTFCVKIFEFGEELKGWDVMHQDVKKLFFYQSNLNIEEYEASQEYSLRTLFRNYNTGEGKDLGGMQVKDMCSGINAMFDEDERSSAMYSVIHSRTLEGEPGFRLLGNVARRSGCDRVAALEMRPDYIKAILEPLGLMKYPIVFITDGQSQDVLDRLLADPDIGPMVKTVPEEACWIGGDLTLGIMSNAFIGNPASTFSGFIAKSRLALGMGHNYLFRAKDGTTGEWKDVCDDSCIFDKKVMKVMS